MQNDSALKKLEVGLEETRQVRAGRAIVFSFLETTRNWAIFEGMVSMVG
jgi:hypothetical protein